MSESPGDKADHLPQDAVPTVDEHHPRPASRPAHAAPERIGPYRILEKVGEGGWGVVYVAEQQQPVRRRVAIKVIKLGMDTEQVIARFEAERQALAMMDHPNIAKVLDAGATESGRPYFVMELVRGMPITDYCDRNNVPTRQRLELFVQVCRAVQHAHQKGIIHRDLKPTNILVTMHDAVPVPKVIDFGIAKATDQRLTDKTVYTKLNQFIGTPAYMSPEQAEMSGLDIDTRSDVYSLGVLLYELLTGLLPFDRDELAKAGIEAMRKSLRDREPPRPSTRLAKLKQEELTTTAQRRSTASPKLIHLLKGDLDWVVMKCLEKDRTRRYETVSGLAADLLRHLGDEPVSARPPSRIYRLRKSIRRNAAAWGTGAAIAMTVAVILLSLTALALWRGRHGGSPIAAAEPLNTVAVLPFSFVGQPDREYLAEMFPATLIKSLSDVEQLQVRPSSSVTRYAGHQRGLNLSDVARDLQVRAVVTGTIQPRTDGLTVSIELVDTNENRVLWSEQLDRPWSQLPQMQAEVAGKLCGALKAKLSGNEQQRLTKLYAKNADAYLLYLEGLHWSQKWTTDAFRRAIDCFQRALSLDPDNTLILSANAEVYINACWLYLSPTEGLPIAKQAAERAVQLDPELAEAHMALGLVLEYCDWNWEGAEREFRRAVELNPRGARMRNSLGWCLTNLGRFSEGLVEIRLAQQLEPRLAIYCSDVAWVHYCRHEWEQAITEVNRGLAIDPDDVACNDMLQNILLEKGDYQGAVAASERVMRWEPAMGESELANIYARSGEKEKAARHFEAMSGFSQGRRISEMWNALYYASLRDRDRTIKSLERAIEGREPQLAWLYTYPRFEFLRSDAAFLRMLRKLNFPGVKAPEEPSATSVAILPFTFIGEQNEREYLAEMIPASIVKSLCEVHELQVRPSSSVARYAKKLDGLNLHDVANDLRVRAVVTGRIQPRPDGVLIAVELVDVNQDRALWSEQYDRPWSQLPQTQVELAQQVCENLRIKLTGKERQRLVKRYTENSEAYLLYLEGLHWSRKWTPDNVRRGITCLDKALALDPNNPLILSAQAEAYTIACSGFLPAKEGQPLAEKAAARAVQLDEELPEAHLALAIIRMNYYWDWVGAEREFKRAIELSPRDGWARDDFGWFLVCVGRVDEAAEQLRQAQQLEPHSAMIAGDAAWMHHMAKQYDRAIEEARKGLAFDPSDATCLTALANSYIEQKDLERAKAASDALKQSDPQMTEFLLACAFARAGLRDEAAKHFQLMENSWPDQYVSWFRRAVYFASLGESDSTIDCLERSAAAIEPELTNLRIGPRFEHLHSNPRFKALLMKLHLAE
jgi:serine/threonine protein kinase/TolB-like protein/Tfp pilus assembly protein PilF